MFFTAALLASLSLHIVSDAKPKNKPQRQVAQAAAAEEDDAKPIIENFKKRVAAGDPEVAQSMNNYMQRLLKIYVRTDALVKQFDEDLKKNERDGKITPDNYKDPMDSSNYSNIQVYYALHKR